MDSGIESLQTDFLLEYEKARLDYEKNGAYTKNGLLSLVRAAQIQVQLANATTGDAARYHKDAANTLIRECYANMRQQGLLEEEAKPAASAPAAESGSHPTHATPEKDAKPAEPEKEDPREELNRLIGLKSAKATINSILNQIMVNECRKNLDMPALDNQLHMVFMGQAGTGKTTVARLVAAILQKMGLLSGGHLVEVTSHELIGSHVGHTLQKTQEVIDKALGGVLFIDEAYALADNTFGKTECIPTLLTNMENHRDDFAVIVAGYTDEMRRFIETNEGLRSRFTHFVSFDNYTTDELMSIFQSMAQKKNETLSEEAAETLRRVLEKCMGDPKFGNARGVRNLFVQANYALSNRLAPMIQDGKIPTKETLLRLEKEDILTAEAHLGGQLLG